MKLTDEDRAALVPLMGADIAKIVTHRHPRVEFYLAGKRAGAAAMRERAAKVVMDKWIAPTNIILDGDTIDACIDAIRTLEVDDD